MKDGEDYVSVMKEMKALKQRHKQVKGYSTGTWEDAKTVQKNYISRG